MKNGSRALIIETSRNPSSDFFVVPRLKRLGMQSEFVACDDDPLSIETAGATLVFVRYVPRRWQAAINSGALKHATVVYFMDDDLLDHAALKGMPLRYRWKINKLAGSRVRRWLEHHSEFACWTNSAHIAGKYPQLNFQVLEPGPAQPPLPEPVTVFYHASASHVAEMRWLLPVMREVLTADPAIRFEVIGNPEIYRDFRSLERTTVLMPMNWTAYQSLLASKGRHIGLAPLLESPFNAARSPTKFFDITAAGACGLYADHRVYRDFIRHEEDGLLLPMQADVWVQSILDIAQQADKRDAILTAAQERCASL